MPYKIQPIRMKQSRLILEGITSSLPVRCHAYVALIVLATVFSMAWYNKVMSHFLVIYRGISHVPLAFSWYTVLLNKDLCV